MSHQRTFSAGISSETKILKDSIQRLHKQLTNVQAEKQKITDQLNCLVLLVRRAWSGDKKAALQVANVVGSAPPEYLQDNSDEHIAAKLKTRPVQNWAKLALGLLNREYVRLQEEIEEQQNWYLQTRNDYLEEQLHYHDELTNKTRDQDKTFLTQFKSRPSSGVMSRPPSGTKRLTIKHLYRDPGKEKSTENVTNVKVKDLVVKASNYTDSDLAFQGLTISNAPKTTPRRRSMSESGDSDRINYPEYYSYDDPDRYSQDNLYDTGSLPVTKRKRPVSGVYQQNSDKMRSRPRSAVSANTSPLRPLAYETTRPVSAQVKNKLRKDKFTNENLQSARKSADKKTVRSMSPLYPKRPGHVDELSSDLDKMSDMERDFIKTKESLQKKLGITGPGLI